MAFKDNGRAYVDQLEPKKLPYEGVWYRFPASVSAATGLLLHRMQNKTQDAYDKAEEAKAAAAADGQEEEPDGFEVELDADLLDDIPEDKIADIRLEILGDAWAKLVADNVPDAVVERMFETLMVWHMFGDQDVAEAYWNDAVNEGPKAPQDHKAKSSRSTAANTGRSGKSTRTRASRAATSPSKKTTPGG